MTPYENVVLYWVWFGLKVADWVDTYSFELALADTIPEENDSLRDLIVSENICIKEAPDHFLQIHD